LAAKGPSGALKTGDDKIYITHVLDTSEHVDHESMLTFKQLWFAIQIIRGVSSCSLALCSALNNLKMERQHR